MAASGFKKIVIAPEPNNAFTSAEWSMEEGKFKLKVEIPCNTTATVKLPDGRLYEVGSGIYQFE